MKNTEVIKIGKIEAGRLAARERIDSYVEMIPNIKNVSIYFNKDKYGNVLVSDNLLLVHGVQQIKQSGAYGKFHKFDERIKQYEEYLYGKVESAFDLCTPALKEAAERGVLNNNNYREIKNGGLMVLEKYTSPSVGVQNIYNALEELYRPKTVSVVERDSESFKKMVKYKQNIFKDDYERFQQENRKVMSYEPDSFEEELKSPNVRDSLEEILGEVESEKQLKTLNEIFNS